MHKQKRALISITSLILCAITLFSVAFAGGYTVQNSTVGSPPPLRGASTGNPHTHYDLGAIIAGYRFTCWRSGEWEKALSGELTGKPMSEIEAADYLEAHNDPGYKLGHSINILINTHGVYHYSNDYGQTKNNAPRMYINGGRQDYLDKISTAQIEIADDKVRGDSKINHHVGTNLATLHYAGDENGKNIDGGSTFQFYTPLLSKVEQGKLGEDKEQSLLGGATVNADKNNPVTIYSGYNMYTLNAETQESSPEPWGDQDMLNEDGLYGTQINEGGNLFTYIYGIDYSNPTSATGGTSKRYAKDGYLTISDIDDHTANVNNGSQKIGDVVAFNQNPSNILDTNNPNSWTNMNSALIATLCGLTPKYGEKATLNNEFGLYDYIIVEPIFSFYYYNKFFMATATDVGILQSESQTVGMLAKGKKYDCWDEAVNGARYSYNWFSNAPYFPGSFGTYMYATDYYFGVDGVLDARASTEAGAGKKHAYVTYAYKNGTHYQVDFDGMKKYAKNEEIYNQNPSASNAYINANTHAVVYSTGSSNQYTLFAGKNSWWYNENGNRVSSFVTPRVAVESMIGAGTWMCGNDAKPNYELVYHSNFDNGQDSSADNVQVSVPINEKATSITFAGYDILKKTAMGKIGTAVWTDKPQLDNSVNRYTGTKYQSGQTVKVTSVHDWFKANNASFDGKTYRVHIYAAWDTKALITTLDRTYEAVDSLTAAVAHNQCYNSDIKSMVLVTADNTIVPMAQSKEHKYLWQPTGDISDGGIIVYSFSKNTITADDVAAAKLGTSKDCMVYNNTSTPVAWAKNQQLFYFDFYSFKIDAPNCDITVDREGVPNGSNHQTLKAENILKFNVARGSQLKYQLVPQEGYRFNEDHDVLDVYDYTNGSKSHILQSVGANPEQAHEEHILTYGSGTLSTNELIPYDTTPYLTINGKQEHEAVVIADGKFIIIPRLDDDEMDPFVNHKDKGYYSVIIEDITTGKVTRFSTNPTNAVNATTEAGVVEYSGATKRTYHIYVSTAFDSNFTNLTQLNDITITNSNQIRYVDYYTTTATVTTEAGGNHTGISTQIQCFTSEQSPGAEDSTPVTTVDAIPVASGKCEACGDAYDDVTTLISLKGTKVLVTRNDNTDWYLTQNVADNSQDRYINGEYPNDGGYNHSFDVTAKKDIRYVYDPYHYITYQLDDNEIHVDTLLSSHPGYEKYINNSGIAILRGKYGAKHDVNGLIATNKRGYDAQDDAIRYSRREVINTVLDYYTVTADADDGYENNGQQFIVDGNPVGDKVYIYSSAKSYGTYAPCGGMSGGRTSTSHTNESEYDVNATLKSEYDYVETSVNGRLTAYDTVVGEDDVENKVFQGANGGTQTFISHVNAPSQLYFRSDLPTHAVKFVFRINDVPYDSLPATVNNSVAIYDKANGSRNPLTFSVETATGNIVATGVAPEGDYHLYLNELNTGAHTDTTYTVVEEAENVFYVDFYTFRVAAGLGINDVSVQPTDLDGWNGTLKYIRFNKVDYNTLAVLPISIPDGHNLTIDAVADSDAGYEFNHWDTKMPGAPAPIIYQSELDDMRSEEQQDEVAVNKMNCAVVVQAEATTEGSTITPPPFPEHNTRYYSVIVRTFLNGRIRTPWDTLTTDITNPDGIYTSKLYNGLARWSAALYGVESNLDLIDHYAGQIADASLAPSREFQENHNISKDYYYHGNAALVPNETVYIDAYYYVQKLQSTVNGLNIEPWKQSTAEYHQFYKGTTKSELTPVTLSPSGTATTIMLKGMQLTVNGLPYQSASESRNLYDKFEIKSAHTFLIPYYSVTMKSVLEETDAEGNVKQTDIFCPTLTFRGQNMQSTDTVNRITQNVMAGTYNITTNDTDTKHKFEDWMLSDNKIYKLEYKDSGNENPYPTLVYTGVTRLSSSTIEDNQQNTTTVNVADETNLIAKYVPEGTKTFKLTLNSVPTYICGTCFKTETGGNTAPECSDCKVKMQSVFDLFQNNNSAANGESRSYAVGSKVPVSAKLRAPIQYHSIPVSITLTLNGSINGIKDEAHTLYYATSPSYATIESVLLSTSGMTEEQKEAALIKNGIIKLTQDENSKYTGNLPYSDSVYHLYIDGTIQDSSYDVESKIKTEYHWGVSENDATIWKNVDKYNLGNSSQFTVTMDADHEYTVYAHPVTTNGSKDGVVNFNEEVDFIDVTIYVSTDFETRLPYVRNNDQNQQVSDTYVVINGAITQLSTANGYTKRVAAGKNFSLYAQRTEDSSVVNVEICNKAISKNTTFLLSYYSVSVDGDQDVTTNMAGYNGPIKKNYLGHYAIDNGELRSVETKVDISALTGGYTNKNIKLHTTNVTIKTADNNAIMGKHTISLIATETEHIGYDTYRNLSGLNGAYYTYLLNDTQANRELLGDLVWHSDDGKYIFGLSQSINLNVTNLLDTQDVIHTSGDMKYDLFIDWTGKNFKIAAHAGSRYDTYIDTQNTCTFNDVIDGTYAIYMDDVKLATTPSSIFDVNGAVSKANELIQVECNAIKTLSSGTTLHSLDKTIQYGTANTSTVTPQQPISSTPLYSANTTKDAFVVAVDSKQIYYFNSTNPDDTDTESEGEVTLDAIKDYTVEVFLDGVHANPFNSSTLPVKFNGQSVKEVSVGQSGRLYSIGMPTLQAMSDAHDNGHSITFDEDMRSAIEYDSTNRVFRVYYYSVKYKVNDERYGSITAPSGCNNETILGPVVVAKYSVVSNSGAILNVAGHTRSATLKYVPHENVAFDGWSRAQIPYAVCPCGATSNITSCGNGLACEHLFDCSNCSHAHNGGQSCSSPHELTDMITCPTIFIANFSSQAKKYTVTLNNYTHSYTLDTSTIYVINHTNIKNGTLGTVIGQMPAGWSIMDKFSGGSTGNLFAYAALPEIARTMNSYPSSVTINLSGSLGTTSHTFTLEKIDDTSVTYSVTTAAGAAQAVFTSVTPGDYQLYIDGVKSTDYFTYNTHDDSCKIDDGNGNLVTPSYTTPSNTPGVVRVAPTYFVRKHFIDYWSQTRNGQEYTDFTLLGDLEPTISHTYVCYNCSPSHTFTTNTSTTTCDKCNNDTGLYMLHSELVTPSIAEDLVYNVYSAYRQTVYKPKNIELNVNMNYAVTIKTVLDWKLQPVFNGTRVENSFASLEYSLDNGTTWTKLTQQFVNGETIFYLPSGSQYRIVGTSASEFNPNTLVKSGVTTTLNKVTLSTLEGSTSNTYYAHYFTVTANSGSQGIVDVNVGQNPIFNADGNTQTANGIFQYGENANLTAQLKAATVPVEVTIFKDNTYYSGLQVYLSKSKTANDHKIKLEYDATSNTYRNDAVPTGPAGITGYYLWVAGQYDPVTKTYTDQCVQQITVDAYVGNIQWSGNCTNTQKDVCHTGALHNFKVVNTTVEVVTIQDRDVVTATVQYYTLSTYGDSGILSTTGRGTYLSGTVVNIDAAVKGPQSDLGSTYVSVTLKLDGKPFTGQTVTIGGVPTTEIMIGTYRTTRALKSGYSYEVQIAANDDLNIVNANQVIGTIKVTGTRTYNWKAWKDNHIVCKSNCVQNVVSELTQKANTVEMNCATELLATTTFRDTYALSGDTTINFYTLRLDGDAGIKNITANGVTYNPLQNITGHGATGTNWTNTQYDTTNFTNLIVLEGSDTGINATVKPTVKNHHEALTALSVTLKLNGHPYTGCVVTIGGATATETSPGVYTTERNDFRGGYTYDIVVNGRPAGRLHLVSYRTYKWYEWSEPWGREAHYCEYHNTTHNVASCVRMLSDSADIPDNTVAAQSQFAHLVARTEFIDEFHSYIDPNQPGGPDPYKDPGTPDDPTKDPDDPYKDPTDPDFDPDKNPEEQPNPEYDPDGTPTPNPDYDPSNPTNPDYDPEDDPDFDPYDEDDGFFEDAPIPFFTVTINTTLDGNSIDFTPVKFENLTTGDTLYIFPQDGKAYVIYDGNTYTPNENGEVVFTNKDGHTVYVTTDGTSVVVILQDGDAYRVSAMAEFEDMNGDDKFDIQDINATDITKYTYNEFKSGAIKGADVHIHIPYYSLTVNVFSNGAQKLPEFGVSTNGNATKFPAPVWIDDVDDTFDSDGYNSIALKPVADAKTVKVYLSGQSYDVDAKTAYDNETTNANNSTHIIDFKNGEIHYPVVVNVYYWSITADHFGGFTNITITSTDANNATTNVNAVTPSGATSNAIASAYFLQGQIVKTTSTLAENNKWLGWDRTESYNSGTTWDGKVNHAQQSVTLAMTKQYNLSAHATTTYTTRHFLHAKDNRYEAAYKADKNQTWLNNIVSANGASWREVYNSAISCEINNRNWVQQTVSGDAKLYPNFNAYYTTSYRDKNTNGYGRKNGVSNTTIYVVVDDKQVGGQSYVDFYYTRNGTTNTAGTPAYNINPQKENVKLTYVLGGGTYNGSTNNVVQHYYVGTNATLIQPTAPHGYRFVGWATKQPTSDDMLIGFVGTGGESISMTHDTVLYAVFYDSRVDIGITANDIHGTVRAGREFTTSATIVNKTNRDFTPTNNGLSVTVEVRTGNTIAYRYTLKDPIIVPAHGTQLVSATIPSSPYGKSLDINKEYTITWTLTVTGFVDANENDNVSSLNPFKPNQYVRIANTARPDYSLNRPSDYDKNKKPSTTSTSVYSWEQWKWENGEYVKASSDDQLNITLILKPENENGLRTYTVGAFGMHNYTTRSGYGLSIHSTFSDLNLPNQMSNVNTNNASAGTLFGLMTFPEFNYSSQYISSNSIFNQDYTTLEITPEVVNGKTLYRLRMQDCGIISSDPNDSLAHYTPMWLPDGKYVPVTYFGGLWTPLGEMTATVQQGQYTTEAEMNTFKIYTNHVTIDGSMYDDLYPNL